MRPTPSVTSYDQKGFVSEVSPKAAGHQDYPSTTSRTTPTQINDSKLPISTPFHGKLPVIIPLSLSPSNISKNFSIPSTLTLRCNFKNPLLNNPTEPKTPLLHTRHNQDPPPGTWFLIFGTRTLT